LNSKYAPFLLILLFFSLSTSLLYGQSQSLNYGLGIKIQCFLGLKKGTSNYTASLALGITRSTSFGKKERLYYQPTYQLAVNIYANGLGTNILKEYSVTEIDVVNSFTITSGYRPYSNEFLFQYEAFNDMTASSFLQDAGRYSATIGTSFIANNHKRHQNVGYLGFNVWSVRFGYYNDATPFDILRLADTNDRWWTGGLMLQIGADRDFPKGNMNKISPDWKVRIVYERFTGDVQDAYRLASRIGLPLVPSKNKKELFLNRAQSSVTASNKNGFAVSYLTFLGHSKDIDVQDIIHNNQGSAKHHSFAKSYWTIGLKYNSSLHQGVIE